MSLKRPLSFSLSHPSSHGECSFTSPYTPDSDVCVFKAMSPREYWLKSQKSKSLLSTLKILSQVCHRSDRKLMTCLRCLCCLQMLSVTSELHPIILGSRLSLRVHAKPEESHRTWL